MNVHFYNASRRHHADAEFLMNNHRIPNAAQLYGFAAECGLKAMLVSHGLPTDQNTGDIIEKGPHKFRTHVNVLVNHVGIFSTDRNYCKYLAMLPNLPSFSDWDPAHRYYDAAKIPVSHEKWRQAATEVTKMLEQANLDGVIA